MPENESQRMPEEPARPEENDARHQGTREGTRVPQGFTVHSSGLASEYARELGWGINQEERTKTPHQKQNYDGGRNYNYGARDFGDSAADTSSAQTAVESNKSRHTRQKKSAA